MELGYTEEIIKDGSIRKIRYVVRKVRAPFVATQKEWYCVYVESRREFTEEELENFPYVITWNSSYPDHWTKSSLTGKECIGWDYFSEGEISREDVLKNAQKVVNYLARTYPEYSTKE